jgi:hypothetical protein
MIHAVISDVENEDAQVLLTQNVLRRFYAYNNKSCE